MPCSADAFLRFLDFDVRSMWDEHFIEGQVIHQFSKEDVAQLQQVKCKSQLPTTARDSSSSSSGTDSKEQKWTAPVTLHLKHVGFLSPVPLLTDRDFELVVAESYDDQTGIAILKALSPPIGSTFPSTGKYVRGVISLSGFIVKPVRYVDPVLRKDINGCNVTYIALVHPMGLIPAALVNIVVGKQTAGLLQLQAFMRQNPVHTLPPRTEKLAKERVLRIPAGAGNQRRKSKL